MQKSCCSFWGSGEQWGQLDGFRHMKLTRQTNQVAFTACTTDRGGDRKIPGHPEVATSTLKVAVSRTYSNTITSLNVCNIYTSINALRGGIFRQR